MAVFKCKMCGASLEISGESVITCSYCGTQQTLPRLSDERRAGMHDRANHFRRNGEYDKAMGVYEQILFEDNTDAESYWSLVLCRYGIEYVKDPATGKRVPTVNRAQYTSVYDDNNYKQAINYADMYQKTLYEQEAAAINEIQKGILAISQKEEPFDVFICYKESDSMGRRTLDSVLATDIYNKLTREGIKVFFSRITLEDKLGTAYEPYIFAALNSAKVMIAVGTSTENFNAVWVKNEWSRYLGLIKNGEAKTLIPAYKDISPYDLPDEFSHLQAQDMSKLGFMQDLVYGVQKILGRTKETVVVKEAVSAPPATGTETLLRRVFLFMEDEEWSNADEYCEKVLDIDPENTDAYLAKLLISLHVSKKENLRNHPVAFEKNSHYLKLLRHADDELKKELIETNVYIKDRNENQRLENLYSEAMRNIKNSTLNSLEKAITILKDIQSYKDSEQLLEQARKTKTEKQNQYTYQYAEQAFNRGDYTTAIAEYKKLSGYRDADEKVLLCIKKLSDKKKKSYIISGIIAGIFLLVILLFGLGKTVTPYIKHELENKNKYNEAVELMENGSFLMAADKFEMLSGYKDSEEKKAYCITAAKYSKAAKYIENKEYSKAVEELAEFDDSDEQKKACLDPIYAEAEMLQQNGETTKAAIMFAALSGYKDAEEKYLALRDKLAVNETVSTGSDNTVWITDDGTVVAIGGNEYGQCDVDGWTDIIAVSAGCLYTVGLKTDGTVVATGINESGEGNVKSWTDIIAVSAGYDHTVGLKTDGTVVATGDNFYGQCDVSDWTDIVAISAGHSYTLGLKSDGTAVATGRNTDGRCDVGNWTDIIAISAGFRHAVGLKSNGTVVAAGYNDDGQCNVGAWTDIVKIDAAPFFTVGLKNDGTAISVGQNTYGQRNIGAWTDLSAISAGGDHTIGIKKDGTVVATGHNNVGQCDISDLTDIKLS